MFWLESDIVNLFGLAFHVVGVFSIIRNEMWLVVHHAWRSLPWIQAQGLLVEGTLGRMGAGLPYFGQWVRTVETGINWRCISHLLVVFQCPLWDSARALVSLGVYKSQTRMKKRRRV